MLISLFGSAPVSPASERSRFAGFAVAPSLGRMARAAAASLMALSLVGAVMAGAPAQAQTAVKEIRFAHHFPENAADWRHGYALAFAEALNGANAGLKVTLFPNQTLMRVKEQWGALGKGTVDMSMFSLAELAEGVPEVHALGLRDLIRDTDHARRLGASPFMDRLRSLTEAGQGVMVLEGVWLAGGVGSAKECVTTPANLMGMAVRTSSKALDALFEGAGALTLSLPSSELQKGLKTGALDGLTFPVASFVSSTIRDELKCLTLPGEGTLYFVYAPLVISKATMAGLTDAQRDAVRTAAHTATVAIQQRIDAMNAQAADVFTKAGVTVNAAAFAAWQADAERTSYPAFAKSSPNAPQVLELMKAVP